MTHFWPSADHAEIISEQGALTILKISKQMANLC